MVEVRSVEKELWLIFTFYSLCGDATSPEHLRSSQFIALLSDCDLVARSSGCSGGGGGGLHKAEIAIAFQAEITPRASGVRWGHSVLPQSPPCSHHPRSVYPSRRLPLTPF